MELKNFSTTFLWMFGLLFGVPAALTYTYSLIAHNVGTVNWNTAFFLRPSA